MTNYIKVARADEIAPQGGLMPATAQPGLFELPATATGDDGSGRPAWADIADPVERLAAYASDRGQHPARRAGADRTINVAETPDALAPLAAGKGTFHALFECSGAAPALVAAIPALRPRGVILQLGLGGDMTLPVQAMTAKEIELRGCFRFHQEFETAVRLMQGGRIDPSPLITHTLPLADAVRAFDIAGDRRTAMKAQIAFS